MKRLPNLPTHVWVCCIADDDPVLECEIQVYLGTAYLHPVVCKVDDCVC